VLAVACRPVDVLNSEWRDGRDRLVLDYKRKRKDVSPHFCYCR
jgi:hypothetical protein